METEADAKMPSSSPAGQLILRALKAHQGAICSGCGQARRLVKLEGEEGGLVLWCLCLTRRPERTPGGAEPRCSRCGLASSILIQEGSPCCPACYGTL